MWELDCEESWVGKNWYFWTVVLEKTLESPFDWKEIQPVYPKGDQPWVFIGRTDVEAETPILWPPHVKNWLTGKDPDDGRDWGQEEKGTTGWDGWMASPTLMGMSLSKLQELVMDREAWRSSIHGFTKSRKWLSDWIELNWYRFTGERNKWPMTKWVHHDTQAQRCKWSQMLHNRGKSLFMKHEAKARGPGAREPDHRHHGQLLFPYKSSLTKILNP